MSLKRPFVPKSDVKQWFTTTTIKCRICIHFKHKTWQSISKNSKSLTPILSNLNIFHSFEVVDRVSETQIHMSEKFQLNLTVIGLIHFKASSCLLVTTLVCSFQTDNLTSIYFFYWFLWPFAKKDIKKVCITRLSTRVFPVGKTAWAKSDKVGSWKILSGFNLLRAKNHSRHFDWPSLKPLANDSPTLVQCLLLALTLVKVINLKVIHATIYVVKD